MVPPEKDRSRGRLEAARLDPRRRVARRQLPPALRPLRRQPAVRGPPDRGAAARARHGESRRLHVREPGRLRGRCLRGARRRGGAAARRALHPDPGPRRRPPVAGGPVRRRVGRAGRPVPRHRVSLDRRRSRRAGPRAGPRRPAPVVPRVAAAAAGVRPPPGGLRPRRGRVGCPARSRPARTTGRRRRPAPARCTPCR